MDVDNESPVLDLPDTQNVDSQVFTQSQDITVVENSTPKLWGRLCPEDTAFGMVKLLKDEYTFGRLLECDISVKGKVSARKESVISKVHFTIFRQQSVLTNGLATEVVYLRDLSQNGTFVNEKLVGKGNTVVLVNNDSIAVSKTTYKMFVYMSTTGYDNTFLPEELRDKYAVSRDLGAGACGVVKLCFSKTGDVGKKFAMKIISKTSFQQSQKHNPTDDKHIMNEINICKALKHPCIIKIEEVYDYPKVVYIILELMEGGELFERIKKYNGIPEKKAKFIFYQIVLAVNHLHENGITHRDLKPENILLSDDTDDTIVKVSDFGLSKMFDSQSTMKTFCGTPMYVAPEILLTAGQGLAYDSQVDVWSLGVILYCTLSGLTPFKLKDPNIPLGEQIKKGIFNFNTSKFFNVSLAAKDLIKKMMTVDPRKRIRINNVLSHPWLNDEEMLKKVNKLLKLNNNENSAPKKVRDNNFVSPVKVKRARLE